MMGRQTGDQSRLLYAFNLEQRIPAHHPLRHRDMPRRADSGREQAFLLHVLSYMRELPSKRADSS
jgi:hypothetical protein